MPRASTAAQLRSSVCATEDPLTIYMSIVIYLFDRPIAEIDAGRHSSRAGAVAGATRFNVTSKRFPGV